MSNPSVISIQEDSDVRSVSNHAMRLAVENGFKQHEAAELALAVSEIAQNVLRYAKEGEATFTLANKHRVLTVEIQDAGQGIDNLDEAIKKGFSTGKSSLGIGLDVAKRSVDEFHIKTQRGQGTQVTLKKFLPIPDESIEYGVISLADERYAVNGDEYLIKEYDGDKLVLAVIDGVGEGYKAHASALAIKDYIANHYRDSLDTLVNECHELLLNSDLQRGAALSVAKLESNQLTYLGIGDTHAYLVGSKTRYLPNQEGIVGEMILPSLRPRKFDITPESFLVMCTDGIKSNLWFDGYPRISAQELANQVFNEQHREYGDVTVLVSKILQEI